MDIKMLITIDSEILGGRPVFTGTRVPVESLFDHLKAGLSLNEFLSDFPSVSREQAIALLDKNILTESQLEFLKEERHKHFNGESQSYKWDEIKKMIQNRKAL